ncbi:REJ domain-containing protein [Pelagophyceae sp. CCMP2097]|nr:REJ domain-containing protein [Pelagophyceae sp. CCMP2097]
MLEGLVEQLRAAVTPLSPLSLSPSSPLDFALSAAEETGLGSRAVDEQKSKEVIDVLTVVVTKSLSPTFYPTSTPAPTMTSAPTECDGRAAPSPASLAYSATGALLLLTLDGDSDLGGRAVGVPFACAEVLSFEGAASTSCSWVSAVQLHIDIFTTTFAPGDSVTLLAGKFKRACDDAECACDSTNEQFVLFADSTSAVFPVPQLQGPFTTSVCAAQGLQVSAAASTGSAGREFVYAWQARAVVSPLFDADFSEAEALLDAAAAAVNAAQSSVFALDAADLAAVYDAVVGALGDELGSFTVAVVFEVTLTNALGNAATSDVWIVTLTDLAVPTVVVVGGRARSTLRSAGLSVQADAAATSCAARPDDALDYAWALAVLERGAEGGSTYAAVSLQSTSVNPRTFKLPPYALNASAVYRLTVTAADRANDLSNTATVMITVGVGPVVAVIANAARTASAAQDLVLSASGSFDDDVQSLRGAAAGLAFKWTCVSYAAVDRPGDCAVAIESGETATLKTGVLKAGDYVFRVTASSAGRSGAAVARITMVLGTPPAVVISSALAAFLRPDAKTTFRAVVAAPANAAVGSQMTSTWALYAGTLDSGAALQGVATTPLVVSLPVTSLNRVHDLVVSAGALVAGGTYTFALSAAVGGLRGEARVTVVVANPPSSGRLSVAPVAGEAFTTPFTLTASSWVGDSLPLKYAFQTRNATLQTSSLEPRALGVRLAVGTVVLIVVVSDAYEATASATAVVDVSPLDLKAEALALATDRALEQALRTFNLDSVCQVVAATDGAKDVLGMSQRTAFSASVVVQLAAATATLLDGESSEAVEQVSLALRTATGVPADVADATVFDSLDVLAGLTQSPAALAARTAQALGETISALLDTGLYDSSTPEARLRRRLDDAAPRADGAILRVIDDFGRQRLRALVTDEVEPNLVTPFFRSAVRKISARATGAVDQKLSVGGSAAAFVPFETKEEYSAQLVELGVDPHKDDSVASAVVRFSFDLAVATEDATPPVDIVVSRGGKETPKQYNASTDITLTCECGDYGPVSQLCYDGVNTVSMDCDGDAYSRTFVCNYTETNCSAWDRDAQVYLAPPWCQTIRVDDGSTACRCDVPDGGGTQDFSTIDVEQSSTVKAYSYAFRRSIDLKRSLLVFISLGCLVAFSLVLALIGAAMDRRDERASQSRAMSAGGGARLSKQLSLFDENRRDYRARFKPASWQRFRAISMLRHPLLTFFKSSKTVSRSIRAAKVFVELLAFAFAEALQQNFEYPDPGNAEYVRVDLQRRFRQVHVPRAGREGRLLAGPLPGHLRNASRAAPVPPPLRLGLSEHPRRAAVRRRERRRAGRAAGRRAAGRRGRRGVWRCVGRRAPAARVRVDGVDCYSLRRSRLRRRLRLRALVGRRPRRQKFHRRTLRRRGPCGEIERPCGSWRRRFGPLPRLVLAPFLLRRRDERYGARCRCECVAGGRAHGRLVYRGHRGRRRGHRGEQQRCEQRRRRRRRLRGGANAGAHAHGGGRVGGGEARQARLWRRPAAREAGEAHEALYDFGLGRRGAQTARARRATARALRWSVDDRSGRAQAAPEAARAGPAPPPRRGEAAARRGGVCVLQNKRPLPVRLVARARPRAARGRRRAAAARRAAKAHRRRSREGRRAGAARAQEARHFEPDQVEVGPFTPRVGAQHPRHSAKADEDGAPVARRDAGRLWRDRRGDAVPAGAAPASLRVHQQPCSGRGGAVRTDAGPRL